MAAVPHSPPCFARRGEEYSEQPDPAFSAGVRPSDFYVNARAGAQDSSSCENKLDLTVGYYIAGSKCQCYQDVFPYEYRMIPGISDSNYPLAPYLLNGNPVTMHFPVPHNFMATVDWVNTVCYADSGRKSIQSQVLQGISDTTIYPTNGVVTGTGDLDMYVNMEHTIYSPPFLTYFKPATLVAKPDLRLAALFWWI